MVNIMMMNIQYLLGLTLILIEEVVISLLPTITLQQYTSVSTNITGESGNMLLSQVLYTSNILFGRNKDKEYTVVHNTAWNYQVSWRLMHNA